MAYTTIDDPSKHFKALLYSGRGDEQSVIGTGFKPDWIWAKSRSNSHYHDLRDSTRGVDERLVSNESDAAGTKDQSYVSFDSDGFSLGDDTDANGDALNTVNTAGNNYVAWQWKANGGTTTTNDASATSVGTIDSVYQANTTAGFSIVTYTGTGSAGTIAHGLGVAPTLIIGKDRSDTSQWFVQHPLFGATHYGELDDTTAFADDNAYFNDSTPTSTVFGVGSDGATGGTTNYVAYCFAPIQGYSKFGHYEGNNDADGPFIYTGFKPAWVMIKNADTSGKVWFVWDNARDTYNVANHTFEANASSAESNTGTGATNYIDMLSNGFKVRQTGSHLNPDGDTVIYMAFAESPFVTSNGTPNNAK